MVGERNIPETVRLSLTTTSRIKMIQETLSQGDPAIVLSAPKVVALAVYHLSDLEENDPERLTQTVAHAILKEEI